VFRLTPSTAAPYILDLLLQKLELLLFLAQNLTNFRAQLGCYIIFVGPEGHRARFEMEVLKPADELLQLCSRLLQRREALLQAFERHDGRICACGSGCRLPG
jgi:hypothetical protein